MTDEHAPGGDVQPGEWVGRIQLLLDARRLREQSASRASILAVWQKAVESARDADLPGMSVDGSLRAAYDAGHIAALALLAANGLRPASGPGHHEIAFHAAAALGGEALSDLVPDSEEIRSLRKGSMYDPVIAGPQERASALGWMRRTLPAIRDALVASDPELADNLAAYP